MIPTTDREQHITKIMALLDKPDSVVPTPYFATRVTAQFEALVRGQGRRQRLLRWTAAMVVLLLLNIVTPLMILANGEEDVNVHVIAIDSLAEQYNLTGDIAPYFIDIPNAGGTRS